MTSDHTSQSLENLLDELEKTTPGWSDFFRRLELVETLGKLGDPRAIPVLEEIVQTDTQEFDAWGLDVAVSISEFAQNAIKQIKVSSQSRDMKKYEQEKQATSLYKILSDTFATSSPETDISIEGIGVHWNCFANRGDRTCVIDCFGRMGYAVSFNTNTVTEAMGRTRLEKELISAVSDWLQDHNLNELYEAFEFVDRDKRFLEKSWDEAIRIYPELEQCATIRLDQEFGDFYYLWFISKDRSCRVYFFGQNQFPTCEFYWDECHLFEILAEDNIPLFLILKHWLCDYAMPSELEQKFSWLDTGKLAKYYEEGRGVEGEFILSWDSIERFYREMVRIPQSPDILKMIAQMRERGYDRTLRTGQSMYTFIVSKSRRHGLRRDQPRIVFDFHDKGMDVFYFKVDGEEKLSYPKIEYTPQIDVLMKRLEAEDID